MNPGCTRSFYQARRTLLVLACVAPVLVLGGVWWLATRVLLVPRVPDGQAPADEVVRFVIDDRGLPRLGRPEREALMQAQTPRLLQDAAFREQFLAELRTSSPDEQKAFRTHLLDVFVPIVLDDVRRYDAMPAEGRPAYIDERIVAYNRLAALRGGIRVTKQDAWGASAPSSTELLEYAMQHTTEREREQATVFLAALQARVAQIVADADLKAEFEARVAAPP